MSEGFIICTVCGKFDESTKTRKHIHGQACDKCHELDVITRELFAASKKTEAAQGDLFKDNEPDEVKIMIDYGFPQFQVINNKKDNPPHGEYLVSLRKGAGDYPYICVANYSYHNGGEWLIGSKVITKRVQAFMWPRILVESLMDGDEDDNGGENKEEPLKEMD